ncbi:MAG TPA: serine hydrolase [Candidatus Binatia bacterium]|nr:serine hydrolase [Candidatus Binatia bacterium]
MRWVVCTLAVLTALRSQPVEARSPSAPVSKKPVEPVSQLVADVTSGRVLRDRNADTPLPSGPLGQLMLALLALDRVDAGDLRLDQAVAAVADVPKPGGVRPLLVGGEQAPLEEWLRALIVTGAPDAAVAVAGTLAPTVEAVVAMMNERARSLGMIGTEYGSLLGTSHSARQPIDVTTARDTARLVTELARHWQVLEWAALSGFPFRDGAVLLRNHNQLLGALAGANGLAVADVKPGGFYAVATARRGALQLVAVTLGAADSATRYAATAEWLEWGFATFERIEIVRAGEPLLVPVRLHSGVERQLIPVAAASCSLLRRRDEERHFEVGFQMPDVVDAPVARDQRIGEIVVRENEQVLAVVLAVSPADFAAADGVVSAVTAQP